MDSADQLAENREQLRQAMAGGREVYGIYWPRHNEEGRVQVHFKDGQVVELAGYDVGRKTPAAFALAQLCRQAGLGSAEEAMELVLGLSHEIQGWVAGEKARPDVPEVEDPED